MGIFDEAIREHLELKRQHGAGASELKQLEDEAFGLPERPGSEEAMPEELAEAPTEFIAQPETAEISAAEPAPEQELAEEEPEATEEKQPEVAEKAPARRESAAEIADLQEAPQPGPGEPSEGPSTQERQAIAEQPTELYDMEEELAASAPAPSEEELIEEGIGEPRLAPVDPLSGLEQSGDVEAGGEDTGAAAVEADEEEDDDFFDEQRLSDELDQALEAPSEDEEEQEDWEPEEQELDRGEPARPRSEEDLLEETPDFLEEAPEADQLWFEQKPPKDFDFDD